MEQVLLTYSWLMLMVVESESYGLSEQMDRLGFQTFLVWRAQMELISVLVEVNPVELGQLPVVLPGVLLVWKGESWESRFVF